MPAYRFRSEKFFSRAFKDFAISFKANPNTKDFSSVSNDNAIKQSVRNLVLTNFGERPFQNEIGSRVTQMLFEPFDVFLQEDLRDEIKNTIERLEPRVETVSVVVSAPESSSITNDIDVAVEYKIVGQSQVQNIEFLLERT
tara:strand:+ start:661 stop:1083 length:423 start_codon:yes stop_codon:yes gene_type:complete